MSGGRILIVDDQEDVREFTARILVRAGHQVAHAANGREAIAAVRDGDFDLVLMDANMPVMDGLTATRAIRALEGRPSQIPVIAFSAGEQSLVTAGVSDHICKPFGKTELLQKVDAWLKRGVEPSSAGLPGKPNESAFQEACELMGRPWAVRGLAKLQVQIDQAFGPGAARNERQLAGQAHALVSLAAVLGFSVLSERCSALQEACRSGHDVQLAFEQAKEAALSARKAAVKLIAELQIEPS